jgi:hypothetical protein
MLGNLHISIASPSDAPDLQRLAQLENRHAFPCPALIARIDGVAVAAVSLDGADAVADPFLPTAKLIEALRTLAVTARHRGQRLPGLARHTLVPRHCQPAESCTS